MSARLAKRELTEGEAEFRYYLSCYQASTKRENRHLGALAAFGAALLIGAIMLGGGGL